MTFTIKERSEIRSQIIKNHDEELKKLEGTDNNAKWMEEVKEHARKKAIGVLKIEKELKRIQEIDLTIDKLNAERELVEQKACKKLPKQKSRYSDSCPITMSICQAINVYANKYEEGESKTKHPIGKKVKILDEKLSEKLGLLSKCMTRKEVVEKGCLDW